MFRSTLLLALIFLACFQLALGDEREEQKKLKAVSSDIRNIENALQKNAGKRERLNHQLRKAEIERGRIQKTIAELENQLAAFSRELSALRSEQSELEANKQKQQQLIYQQINMAYRLGREEPVKLLLNQEDPDRLARSLKYYNYFLTARAEKLDRYIETLDRLSLLAGEIDTKTSQLQERREQLKSEEKQLEASQNQRTSLLAELKQQSTTDRQRLAELQKERARLVEVLDAIDRAIANIPLPETALPFKQSRGKMQWPVAGKLRHSFGSRRNAKMTWDGWFLEAPEGKTIRAVHSGRVVFSDYLRGYGLLVIVDHGEGYMSLYAHNQVLLKETGDWVSTADSIARAGNSGGQTMSGLYFEIRHNGKPTNPKGWLTSG